MVRALAAVLAGGVERSSVVEDVRLASPVVAHVCQIVVAEVFV